MLFSFYGILLFIRGLCWPPRADNLESNRRKNGWYYNHNSGTLFWSVIESKGGKNPVLYPMLASSLETFFKFFSTLLARCFFYVRHILHNAGNLACSDRWVDAPGKFLVCFKIAPEYTQTVLQAIQIIFVVNTGRNPGEPVKIKKQINTLFQKWHLLFLPSANWQAH